MDLLASQWILRRDQLPEYRFALELMSQADREEMFWRYWDELDSFAQRDLAKATFQDYWFKLIADYGDLSVRQKGQALEALGLLPLILFTSKWNHIPTPARIILTAGLRLKTVCFFTLAAPLRKSSTSP